MRAKGDSKVKLSLEFREGSDPLIFARAYVPQAVGEIPAWYLRDSEDKSQYGIKVILRPKYRDEVIKRHGVSNDFVLVDSLIVTGTSQTQQSVQANINKW